MRISSAQIYQHGLDRLLQQQAKTMKLQGQLASGLRVETPSDDPIASAQIELMSHRINSTELLQKNRDSIEGKVKLEESIISSCVDNLHRLRVLQIQAGNGALSDSDRKSLAIEMTNLLSELKETANSKDSEGYYLFSGSQTGSAPISLDVNGKYVYNGDNTQRFQSVSESLQIAVNDPGDAVFMRLPSGNGTFSVSAGPTVNAGTAVVSTGLITNPAAYVDDNYTMTFAVNSLGKTVVMVTGAASGNVLPPSGLVDDAPVYKDGSALSFNGMELTITGTPQPGDTFSIASSLKISVFDTIQSMISNLEQPQTGPAQQAMIQTSNNQLLAQLDTALSNFLNVQANIGSRLNQLDHADSANSNLLLTSKETLKQLQEIDATTVASDFNLQLLNLQAAQQSFVRIQGLSLFNYL